MKAAKRVEIVVDAVDAQRVIDVLDRVGVGGYTRIRDVTGSGDRGIRSADELTGVFKNNYFLVVCDDSQAVAVAEGIRPILDQVGGICLISDCLVIH
ncbi:MAG TPA: transcriptional regulator [Thermoanaerobaculia bacterium]|nr:transcriptional regulator [Thermoanaerobaculia bacterium]